MFRCEKCNTLVLKVTSAQVVSSPFFATHCNKYYGRLTNALQSLKDLIEDYKYQVQNIKTLTDFKPDSEKRINFILKPTSIIRLFMFSLGGRYYACHAGECLSI